MGFWGELQSLKTEFFYHFLKLTIERIWMDLFRFSVYSFLWKMSDGRDQKKERWRSLVARREELWVTQRNERCNSHKKERKKEKGEEEEEEKSAPANQQNGAEPRIPKRLGLSTRLSLSLLFLVIFFCVCMLSALFVGSRNTQHALSWPPPFPPFFPSRSFFFCCSAALRSVFLSFFSRP